jgi:hypothetical protein
MLNLVQYGMHNLFLLTQLIGIKKKLKNKKQPQQ